MTSPFSIIKVSVQVRGTCSCFVTKPVSRMRNCQHLAQPPSWRITPCRLSETAYSIYSQFPSILKAVPPSTTWGRDMPCWQGSTYQGIYVLYHNGILFQIVAVSVVGRLSDTRCHNYDKLRIFLLITKNTPTNIVQVLYVKVQTNKCRKYSVYCVMLLVFVRVVLTPGS
jgi:hypothetical protein